jgi:hypothetical protein
MASNENLPYFLRSWDNLFQHFDEHFPEGSNERGDAFLTLAQRLIPVTEVGRNFPSPEISEKKSHDKGVDIFTATNDAGQQLLVQSRFRIHKKDDLDNVISKFASNEGDARAKVGQGNIFPEDDDFIPPVYMLITSSKMEGIRKQYLDSNLPSKAFYLTLEQEGRLSEIDGPRILTLLQTLYRQSHQLPNDVTLTTTSGWIAQGTVWLGTVQAQTLVELYQKHGSALFFENIRDFLGLTSGKKVEDRVTVNAQIMETVKKEPAKMLERNNGVTFRAGKVDPKDEKAITLSQAAIVNGCQTTMCLVNSAPVSPDCLVQVKVVLTDNGWEIATAANYQNPVTLIELDLARYLRPQVVKKAATDLGYSYEDSDDQTITGVLNAVYQRKIDYEEMKLLYLGLFSLKPSNLFESLYTKLLGDVLHKIYAEEKHENEVFSTLFLLLTKAREAMEHSQRAYSAAQYAPTFKRFRQEDKPSYRIYLALLAACGATRTNVATRSQEPGTEAKRLMGFLRSLRDLLEQKPEEFLTAYLYAFSVLAETVLDAANSGDDGEVSQRMHRKVTQSDFSALHQKLLLRIDGEKIVSELRKSLPPKVE